MKSPFPGMDPYLEKYWHEVYQLRPAMRPRLDTGSNVPHDLSEFCVVEPNVNAAASRIRGSNRAPIDAVDEFYRSISRFSLRPTDADVRYRSSVADRPLLRQRPL